MSTLRLFTSSAKKVTVSQTARQRRSSNLKDVPSMADFMHTRSVLHQYRHFMRCIHRISDEPYQQQARKEVQQRFRQLREEKDGLTIKMALKEGERQLAQLQAMVGYTPAAADQDSWLNTKDEQDPRGRVGVEWPWDSSK